MAATRTVEAQKLQLGIIVANLEASIASYERVLGVGPFRTLDVPEAGVRAAMADWAGVEIELIEAANDEAAAMNARFLKGRPARLQHIGAYVPDRAREVEHFKEIGARMLHEDVGGDDVHSALADLRNDTGFLLEILERLD
jgi:methylmalonyl-CoA/ethylmalonyl-CoA epimerase